MQIVAEDEVQESLMGAMFLTIAQELEACNNSTQKEEITIFILSRRRSYDDIPRSIPSQEPRR
jgi:hypothetical protein